jgi:hypothetical protein
VSRDFAGANFRVTAKSVGVFHTGASQFGLLTSMMAIGIAACASGSMAGGWISACDNRLPSRLRPEYRF